MATTAGRQFHVILDVVRAVPPGRVVSYADVAELAIGSRRGARTVGWALASCPADVPWWRVVRATGDLPGVNDRVQTRLLRAEGIKVRSGRTLTTDQFDHFGSAHRGRFTTNRPTR